MTGVTRARAPRACRGTLTWGRNDDTAPGRGCAVSGIKKRIAASTADSAINTR